MMRSLRHSWQLQLPVLLAMLLMATVANALDVPPIRSRVTDLASLLQNAEQQQLEQLLLQYEKQSGQQFAVLIIPTLEDEVIEQYSIRVVEAWQLGKKGRDDGLLLLIALKEHQMRIEVGYGLEGNVPDAIASRVIRDVIVPAFRQEQYARGIGDALQLLMKAASGQEIKLPEPTEKGHFPPRKPLPRGLLLLLFILMPIILPMLLGGGRRGPPWGGGGFGGFGGGWSSGGGGGFSGGGGGFGGGGSSGRW